MNETPYTFSPAELDILAEQERIQASLTAQNGALAAERPSILAQQYAQLEAAWQTDEPTPEAVDLGVVAMFLAARRDDIIADLNVISPAYAKGFRVASDELKQGRERAIDLMFVPDDQRSEDDKAFVDRRMQLSEATADVDAYAAFAVQEQARIQEQAKAAVIDKDKDEDDTSGPDNISPFAPRQKKAPYWSGKKAA